MKNILCLIFCCVAFTASAQVRTWPLNSNPVIAAYIDQYPDYVWGQDHTKSKWGAKDTLSLPFFDDFSTSHIYPDSSKWLNNQVYVNRHFARFPPSLGVATFDVLDALGNPYNGGTVNPNFFAPGDSLLSQPINLLDSAGTPYTTTDSIYLSFFVQGNGYGYHLGERDSIRLFLKNKFDVWIQVWSMGGPPASEEFTHIMIPIDAEGYLHAGFQFLFTTWTKQVGNANHWHIDYVFLDKNRRVAKQTYPDYAVQTVPTPLLKNYSEMPFSHFMIDPQGESADSLFVRASNLDSITLNIEVKHTESYNGDVMVNTNFSANAGNIPSGGSTRRRTENYNFYQNLNEPIPVVINRTFEIREAGVINAFTDNDKVETRQIFYDYFAYDDGSAEQGFGFDHETNPSNLEGDIALKFKLNKQDTLYAIGTFFNQAVFDVSRQLFTFRVWQSIAEPGGSATDVLIYESEPLSPQYTGVINGFSIHYIDTLLVLPPGNFYIGWHQNTMYNLNVGWDRNSGNVKDPDISSDQLFYKLFGQWYNSNLPFGALMMRPYVGSKREVHASIKSPIQVKTRFHFYPNPARDRVYFHEAMEEVQLLSQEGKILLNVLRANSLNIEHLPAGIYYLNAMNRKMQRLHAKLIIFDQ